LVGHSIATTVTVGSGTLAGIAAGVEVRNPPSFTTLVIDDHLDAKARTVTMTSASISGLGPVISYTAADLLSLTLLGGSGKNIYKVLSTPSNGHYLGTTLSAGTGSDTINVGSAGNTLDAILGLLSVNGQGGNDTLNVNDQGSTLPHAYTV